VCSVTSQANIRQKHAADAAETNRRMALARAHDAWQKTQTERAASDRALKAEARLCPAPPHVPHNCC